jgi:uncharacterized membrane protein
MLTVSRFAIPLLFIAGDANHFASPGVYSKILPDYLPWPLALIYVGIL